MKLAVVGNPIAHSKSPLIFRFLFDEINREYSYERILLNAANEIPLLFEEGYDGINITAPFKELVIPYLDELSVDAKAIKSVNTVVKRDGKLIGYNTDVFGVLNAFKEELIELKGKRCLILGAGGASRAAIYALLLEQAEVKIYNRSLEKAQKLAEEFKIEAIQSTDLANAIQESDILIDTLPAGVNIVPANSLHSNLIVLDASYPQSVYKGKGISKLISGEYWLINQAIPAFELFTEKKIKRNEFNQNSLIEQLIK
ncbi:MAG: shikimate dehydrogenase [Bacteroidales bacterium]|nr:shikimate dehydrogenase [Bacteroidales bacterium]